MKKHKKKLEFKVLRCLEKEYQISPVDGLTSAFCIMCNARINVREPKDILYCPTCGWKSPSYKEYGDK